MSDPAHYVLVEPRGVSHFFSNWGGISTNFDLFWGPEHALTFVRKQQRVPDWDPEDSFEGGALLDPQAKTMLLFGGEGMSNPLKHRVTMTLMRRVWGPDWRVDWAAAGIGGFADYLGLPRETARTVYPHSRRDSRAFAARTKADSSVVSVRWPDGRVTLHPTGEDDVSDFLEYHPNILERLASLRSPSQLAVPVGVEGGAYSGMHLDVAARRADLWLAGVVDEPSVWDGWQLTHHVDRFEVQEEATGGALRFAPLPQQEVVEYLAGIYRRLSGEGPDPHAMLGAMNPDGKEGFVNPRFFTHTPHRVPEEERIRLLDRALAGLPELWRAEVSQGSSPRSSSRAARTKAAASASPRPTRRRSQGVAPKRPGPTKARPKKKST
jgi:hypothetical protein